MTQPMLDFLAHCVRARMNALISGGTGAGKTTLLNVLSSFIGERERIVTIEDAAELQLHQEHVARLETRPPNVEGKGAVRQRQLLINALRMRPDRIVVGEVRGEEALDMLQAMNTGHDGSLTTVHANTPRDALSRIETMIAMGATNLPERAMRQQIASAIQLVVQQTRSERRVEEGHEHLGDHRHGRRHHHHAGDLPVREDGRDAGRQGDRPLPRDRRPAEAVRAAARVAASICRPTCSKASRRCADAATILMFLIGAGTVLGAYAAITYVPGMLAQRAARPASVGRVCTDRRARTTRRRSSSSEDERAAACRRPADGADQRRLLAEALIEQSGVKTTPGAIVVDVAARLALLLGFVGVSSSRRSALLAMPAACSARSLPFALPAFTADRRG